jgi:hypothetical protein
MSKAVSYDIRIQIGSPWSLSLDINNPDGSAMNLVGATLKAQVRENAAAPVLMEMVATIPDPVNGKVNLYLSGVTTATLTKELIARYDVMLTTSVGSTIKLIEGSATAKYHWPLNNLNVQLAQGETWSVTSLVKNPDGTAKNLSGYTATAKVKNGATTIASPTAQITLPNTVTVSLTSVATGGLTAGAYVYDVYLDNGTEAFKFLDGKFQLDAAITR